MIEAIGFDGDDTLWQSETAFAITHDRVRALLASHVPRDVLDAQLLETERRNLEIYGYGVKAFTLSMIETALDLAGEALTAADVRALLDAGKELLAHPVEMLPGAEDAVRWASAQGLQVVLITKGDLFHQESKVARSGLGELVDAVEVVAEKDVATYQRALRRNRVDPTNFVMVGNALRSDAAPVLELGGWAVHVPHPLTWALEAADDEDALRASPRFREVPSLIEIPTVIPTLDH
ncbi:MAG: HAD family hydrolase [Actinomycetota bacterium]|nr:HAD family hydrolase [Actinomycetota bacterium]